MIRNTLPAACLATAAACLTACSSTPGARPVAAISHVVFVDLADPADADALLADARATLAPIPSVTAYSAGKHLDTGRPTVLGDYDVGMVLGFDDTRGLNAYVAHPDHIAFVERWRPRLTGLRVYDIAEP
jgi:hypothetical protein